MQKSIHAQAPFGLVVHALAVLHLLSIAVLQTAAARAPSRISVVSEPSNRGDSPSSIFAELRSPSIACETDEHCSLNGVCKETACICDPAWGGKHCNELNILPGKRDYGYNNIAPPTNTSSWGGAVLYNSQAKKWYMWATELEGKCGMHTWTTNSQTVRASAPSPEGPYGREAVQFPVWSHEVDVTAGPAGEAVAFMSYRRPCPRPLCTSCTDGTTDPACKKKQAGGEGGAFPSVGIEDTDATYMSWAAAPEGPWSEPARVLMPNPEMDSNVAAVIHANGTLLGMWRDHHPGGHHSTPHLFFASDWKDNSTYTWSNKAVFSDKDVKGGLEDMFLWVDARGHYHALFHQMFDCQNCGAHAYSVDGLRWTYTGTCYGPLVRFDDGTSFTFPFVERPHLVFDESGTKPVALTNGVKTGVTVGLRNDDQSFTLLRPLQQ